MTSRFFNVFVRRRAVVFLFLYTGEVGVYGNS